MVGAGRLLAAVLVASAQLALCTDDAPPDAAGPVTSADEEHHGRGQTSRVQAKNTPKRIHDAAGPTWWFKCIPEQGCQRVSRPQPPPPPAGNTTRSAGVYENLDVCRMACGRWGSLWPRPTTASLSAQTVRIHPNYLRFDLSDAPPETRNLLAEMSQLLTQNMLAECAGAAVDHVTTPVLVHIDVRRADLTLDWDTDESYMLNLQSTAVDVTVRIVANSAFGARHGLETLSQLVSAHRLTDAEGRKRCSLFMTAGAKIKDEPVYPHRGLVLDTSRNFIPVADVKRTVDGMAASKMNVLHWHATDTHSFPLQSLRVPQLTKYGAYSSSEVYSVEEVRELLRYARSRGVRVVLEIDSPAHAGNGWQWGKEYGMGELAVCVNAQPWRPLCIQPPCGQLNPANPRVYSVLQDLYRDIADTWPRGELFHMGGDEVFINCWNSTEEIVSYMRNKGFDRTVEGFVRMWAEFHATILGLWDAVSGAERPPVMLWSSELTQPGRIQNFLSQDRYVIEVWEPVESSLLGELTELGYRTVAAPKDVWYLDHGFWGVTRYANWRRMYAHRLPRARTVLGGEVAMWSEYVDANALDGRIWPRAAAVAERLWADPESTAVAAEPRMQRHRSRLAARGLRPDVLAPEWCAQNDMRCL